MKETIRRVLIALLVLHVGFLVYLLVTPSGTEPFILQDDAAHLDHLERETMKQTEQAWFTGKETREALLVKTEGRLRVAATRLGATVVVSKTQYAGLVDPRTRFIQLNPDLGRDAQLMTLGHELGHIFEPVAWNGLNDDGERYHDESEVFAEAVSYLVVSAERDETSSYSNYLVMHRNALYVLHTYRREIIFAANFIRGER